jgi:hypothetical protein
MRSVAPLRVNRNPPMAQTIFHSCALTGCTESREYLTSAMSLSRDSV